MAINSINLAQFDPVELGFPEKFNEFREIQCEAVEWVNQVFNRGKRFAGVSLPTGAGKTLFAMALAKMLGARTAILTGTKGLQEQYIRDFAAAGLFDIRGKDNYKCAGKPNLNLRCKYGGYEGCLLAGGLGCTYESERYHAKNSQVVISNYAYWVRGHKFGPGLLSHVEKAPNGMGVGEPINLNPFELLICDEGHHAMEHLAGALRVTITERQLHAAGVQGVELKGSDQWVIAAWGKWASRLKPMVTKAMGDVAVEIKRNPSPGKLVLLREKIRDLDQLNESVDSIQSMQEGDWIVEERAGTTVGRVWDFDCVWPGKWSERLWVGVPKVVVMSATLHPMSMNLLGVKKDEREFKEWGRVFPAKNTPVVHVKTVKLNRKSTEEDQLRWVKRVDEIVQSRGVELGRKGIVHTVSYARQQLYLKHSEMVQKVGGLFHANNSSDPDSGRAQDVYERFLGESKGVLVSPSFGTGWDFPGDQCRWQVIVKVPFPDSRGKVMQARMERDERYLNYITMQELVQACGRGTRNEKDWCEVFIVDDSITYFLMRNGGLAPDWFKVRAVGEKLPPPIFVNSS